MKLYIKSNSASPCRAVIPESLFSSYAPGNEQEYATQLGFIEVPEPTTPQPENHVYEATKVDGVWTTGWVSQEVIAEEIEYDRAAHGVRRARNAALTATDWTQGRDIPESVSQQWVPYRQALRDVTNQPGFPHNITWPQPPQ